jgi:intein/homing endonuclease
MGKNYRKDDSIETVEFNDDINGKNGPVKTSVIQRHEPHDIMLFIKTKSGHSIICQANHPLWIKKNPIHSKYDNKYCRLIGDNQYTETFGTRKLFRTDEELKEVTASDVKQYDAIWIDNSDAINNENVIIPDISGYVAGIYCAEGCKIYSDRDKKANMISQNTEGPIKERIYEECLSAGFKQVTKTKQGITCWENERRLNDVILGSYAWEKRLKSDFINYDKQWLKDFISGLTDGDGSVFNFHGTSTCIRIYTTSYYLAEQLNAICLKLGYKFNICKMPYSEKYKRTRLSFSCDIKFLENPQLNSEKFKSVTFKPISLRKENIIKGFDPITVIREIEPMAWRYPVYDIKTETGEYLLNFIQNHNTFHTGGGATAVKHDILQEIIDGDPLVELEK